MKIQILVEMILKLHLINSKNCLLSFIKLKMIFHFSIIDATHSNFKILLVHLNGYFKFQIINNAFIPNSLWGIQTPL